MRENTLTVIEKSPIQQIDRAAIAAAAERMSFIVPNIKNVENLTIIAQEAILYRLVPGRDVHYFENGAKLERVFDYKYLQNFATFKEQLLSGDNSASLEETYHTLTEEDKIRHGIPPANIAASCTIITRRERQDFAEEVKRWLDMGFDTGQAVAMAKETYGELGTTAIGHVVATKATPEGWSPLQKAEKLAFKNAVNRKYGIPTADEMSTMAYRMAKRALPEDWSDAHLTKPIDVQAKLADLETMAAEAKATVAEMSPKESAQLLEGNVTVMRDTDDTPIGEDQDFTTEFWRMANPAIEAKKISRDGAKGMLKKHQEQATHRLADHLAEYDEKHAKQSTFAEQAQPYAPDTED